MRFHAIPPQGIWFNDPNGLTRIEERWTLFAQVRTDAPAYDQVGWARLTSPDLLRWSYRGIAIPAGATSDAWSGSIMATGDALEAFYTRHTSGPQDQVRRMSRDAGATWSEPEEMIGPARLHWRDPWVFHPEPDGPWFMLLAVPCAWDPEPGSRSSLEIHRSDDGRKTWSHVGALGPWSAPGVMWEVPVLVRETDAPERWSLLISTIDRRPGAGACQVRRWRGSWAGETFIPDGDPATDHEPLDHGPDFYAAIAAASPGPAGDVPLIIGWASSWEIARKFPWPGFAGGPISLPRVLTRSGMRPLAFHLEAFSAPMEKVPAAGLGRAHAGEDGVTLTIEGEGAAFALKIDGRGEIKARRIGEDWLAWDTSFQRKRKGALELSIFVDGPLIELHIGPDDVFLTVNIPCGAKPLEVAAKRANGAALEIAWSRLPASV
jgi:sucrose-6-phosphate hydrolase SacC (GH32 family)